MEAGDSREERSFLRMPRRYFVVGGAGFIGSHLVKAILAEEEDVQVTVYDNFSSGRPWHLDEVKDNPGLEIIVGDVKDKDRLTESMQGAGIVYHLASNPDIARAITEPDIDFREGTCLTNNVLEAMRINGVKKLIYSSGSGVYGDTGLLETGEDYSPMLPISTYGASKLGCEAMICSYCHMFDMDGASLRFANVVGPHQTHGVGYDFVRKLMQNPGELEIMGDGSQSKSYIYVSDVVSAMRMMEDGARRGFTYYNVATLDYMTVTEIADIVVEVMGLETVEYRYAGGDRGWKGDVPIVRLSSQKLRDLGWSHAYSSKEAMRLSVESTYEDAKLDRFGWDLEAE